MERTLWQAQARGGALQLDASVKLKLTNLRAIRDDKFVMLKDCEIVVANKAAGSGDVQFVRGGIPVVTFAGISDPDGVAAMASSAREDLIAIVKQAEEEHRGRAGGDCAHEGSGQNRYPMLPLPKEKSARLEILQRLRKPAL